MGQLESVYIEGIDDIDNDSILHGDLTVERVAKIIKNGEVKNIVVMSGAGISVSAGIPDFRSPGTGLYYNLEKYKLPTPESMFDIDFFREHPECFYSFVMVSLWEDSDSIGPFSRTILTYLYTLLHKTTKQEGNSAKELYSKH